MQIRRGGVWCSAGLGAVLALAALVLTALPAGATFPGSNGELVFERGGNIWVGWRPVDTSLTSWKERALTSDGTSRNPRWSPDGTRLVFNTTSGSIITMSPTRGSRRVVTAGRSYQPAWSPRLATGRRIVFVKVPAGAPGDLWTVAANGGSPTRLTRDGAAACGDSRPSWSPDGSRIVYLRTARGADATCGTFDDVQRVVVLTLATMQRRLVSLPTLDPNGEPFFQTQLVRRPDFSADGERILVAELVGGDDCEQYLGWYDVVTGSVVLDDYGYGCEGGDWILDAGPTPQNGRWVEVQEWDSAYRRIAYPCGANDVWICGTQKPEGVWNTPDVQPLP